MAALVGIVGELEKRGGGVLSLTENMETGNAVRKSIFHVFASLAEFERNLIRKRTRAGLDAARARGRFRWEFSFPEQTCLETW